MEMDTPTQLPTKRQSELLHHIGHSIEAGRTPVVADLIARMKLSRESSLTDLLKPLERKGYITIQGGVRGRQRVIELTVRGKTAVGVGLPVLGHIPAGPLCEALQESGTVIGTMAELLLAKPGDFLLEVGGDSMIGDGILPGDLVLLRPGRDVQNGEIAAVQVNQEEQGEYFSTLKHVHYSPGRRMVRLRASNPLYEDVMVPASQVSVAGVYRGLVRDYRSGRKGRRRL
jgi:repressor LexA